MAPLFQCLGLHATQSLAFRLNSRFDVSSLAYTIYAKTEENTRGKPIT